MTNIKYRPEIDGVRAIAVAVVVLYHANIMVSGVNPFKGGYVGVDVFFVISGYLITSIILHDLNSDKFSFKYFYERRARRILPALFTVMLASIPFAWIYMLPKAMDEYAGSILSSLFFSSNILFWNEDSYWAEPSELKPFLHTWSLSVEEQFYLLFPLMLVALWKLAPKYVTGIFFLLGLFSLLLADHFTPEVPEFTFYLLPARAWELLAGAILGKIEHDRGRQSNRTIAEIAPGIGLCLIIYSVLSFSNDTPHPSFFTIIPVLGTMLLIWFSQEGGFLTNILSNRLVVGVGIVSYGFYLWHYPVFALSKIKDKDPSQYAKIGWVALSLILAIFTYFLIEQRFRSKTEVRLKPFLACISAAFMSLSLFALISLKTGGVLYRYTDGQMKFLNLNREQGGDFTQYVTSNYNSLAKEKQYIENGLPKLLLIGDSYSQDFFNVLKESGRTNSVQAIAHFVPTGCQNVSSDTPDIEQHILEHNKKPCEAAVRVGDDALVERLVKSDGVIVATSWTEYTDEQILKLVEKIKSFGVDNVLVVGRKEFPTITTEQLIEMNLEKLENSRLQVSDYYYGVQKRMSETVPPDEYLNLHSMFCGSSIYCPISTPDGYLISFDGRHLTQEGARYIGSKLSESRAFDLFWAKLYRNANQKQQRVVN